MSTTAPEPARERQLHNPWTWQDAFGFVQAHEVVAGGRTIFCAGQTSVGPDGRPLHAGDMRRQLDLALDNLETVLREAGATLAHVARLNYYTTDVSALLENWGLVLERIEAEHSRPASTLLGVQALAFPELLVEIEATVVVDEPSGGARP